MNKSELIERIADKADVTKAVAGRALDTMIEAVIGEVASGGNVTLVGFGTFTSAKRAGRTGRNPQTGKEIKIAPSVAPKFKPGAGFKSAVNSAKKPAKKK